jgi:hypothetical protein
MLFVSVEGEGSPESATGQTEFQTAMGVLFGIVYTIKFWSKKYEPPTNYAKFTVAPVEGLWWTKSGNIFDTKQPDDWKWKVMLRLPALVTTEYFEQVVNELVIRKNDTAYEKARLERFNEGLCVQLMHFGPYDREEADIERMHAFALGQGYTLTGKHHEIYFNDPRRTSPEKLRTILRQPISE